MKRLTAIDAARGIASVLVMLYHCNAVVQTPKYFGDAPFDGFFGLRGVRMPFFFAMSGFMLSLVHGRDLGHPERLGRYLLARCVRIYPAYWVVLALTIPVYVLRPDFGNASAEWGSIVKSIFLWPQPGVPYLVVAWTLQCVMLFYLVFAVAIWRLWVGLAVFVIWQGAVLATIVAGAFPAFPWSFLLDPLHLSFLLGTLAARLVQEVRLARPQVWFAFGLGFLVVAATTDFAGYAPIPWTWQLVTNGFAAAVMLAGLSAWELARPLKVPRFLLTWGEASYSIFLIHYPLLSVLAKLGMAAGIGRWLPAEGIFLLFAGISISAGVVFHRVVEKPLLRQVQRWVGLSRGKQDPASTPPDPSSRLS